MKLKILLLFSVFSVVLFGQSAKKSLTEKQKIEALILSVENLKDAKFYRNGTTYNAKEAADHLRMKWEKAGSRVKTANDFIEKVASKSYLSGSEYKIIYSNGKEVKTSVFFYAELKKINGQK